MKTKEVVRRSFNITSVTEEFGKDTISRNSYLLAIGVGLLILGIVILMVGKLPSRVPLLLTNPWGEERLVIKEWLFAAPILVWGIVAFNLMLGKTWRGEELIVPRVLAIGSLTVSLMLLTALWGMLQSFFL